MLAIVYSPTRGRPGLSSYRTGIFYNATAAGRPADLLRDPLIGASPLVAWLKAVWHDPASLLESVEVATDAPPGLLPPRETVRVEERVRGWLALAWSWLGTALAAAIALTPAEFRPLLPVAAAALTLMLLQHCFFASRGDTQPRVPTRHAPPPPSAPASPVAVPARGKGRMDSAETIASPHSPCDAQAITAQRVAALVRESAVRLHAPRRGSDVARGFAVTLVLDPAQDNASEQDAAGPSTASDAIAACDALAAVAFKFSTESVSFTVLQLAEQAPLRPRWHEFLKQHGCQAPLAVTAVVQQHGKPQVCLVPGLGGDRDWLGGRGVRERLELAVESILAGSGRWQLLCGECPL